MKLRLKKGTRVKASADVIYNEIERVRDGGDLDLQKLVDASKPKKAPLHQEFTWSDGVAAEKWRLTEARKVVQAIEVVHEEGPSTRAFESVEVVVMEPDREPEQKRMFRTTAEIMADPIARDELLARAIRDAIALRKRYAALQELAQVFAAIDKAVVSLR